MPTDLNSERHAAYRKHAKLTEELRQRYKDHLKDVAARINEADADPYSIIRESIEFQDELLDWFSSREPDLRA